MIWFRGGSGFISLRSVSLSLFLNILYKDRLRATYLEFEFIHFHGMMIGSSEDLI